MEPLDSPAKQWPALRRLVDHAQSFLTPEDVKTFALGDPGYAGYVSAWTKLLDGEPIRRRSQGDYSEQIGAMNYSIPDSHAPQRFLRFRIWTCSFGMLLIANDYPVHPPNYLVINILQDASSLADPSLTRLLIPAFEEFREFLRSDPWENEHPFCLLAIILLRLQFGEPPKSLQDLAKSLIADEATVRRTAHSEQFLLGLTNYNQFHEDWRQLVAEIMPADVSVEELTLIRQAILSD